MLILSTAYDGWVRNEVCQHQILLVNIKTGQELTEARQHHYTPAGKSDI